MTNYELDPDQEKVLANFFKHRICIITGGPGTGKSFITKTICDMLDTADKSFVLCSPTGKAAKRLSEATDRSAYTIHRLLKAGYFGDWGYNKFHQVIGLDYVIVDEVSMCDIILLWRLLQSFPVSTNFIFIGDKDQLPPVGPGSTLRDMINSKKIVTFNLTYNHRQGKGSLIAHNAGLINTGSLKLVFGEDLIFQEASNPILIREQLPALVKKFKGFGYDLIRDFQVLSPQKETSTGVNSLNEMLRFMINPDAKSYESFSVGDKVMQTVNNYQLGIFNGYIGIIREIRSTKYIIDFFDADDESSIDYPKYLAGKQLIHAFCCTIHKYQGSEAKAGIFIMSSSHPYMHSRNLLYTGLTRFKERCVILGDPVSLKRSIENNTQADRYSRLDKRL